MKRIVNIIVLWLLVVILLVSCGGGGSDSGGQTVRYYDVPKANIIVDGEKSDWNGIIPALNDPQGDDPSSYTGGDIKSLYIAQSNDLSKIYVMMEMWDGNPNSDLASRYTSDGDSNHPNVAQGYGVMFTDTCFYNNYPWPCFGAGARYDNTTNTWYLEGLSMITGSPQVFYSDTSVAVNTVIEFEIPISMLKTSVETRDFKADIATSAYGDRREEIREHNGNLIVRYNK